MWHDRIAVTPPRPLPRTQRLHETLSPGIVQGLPGRLMLYRDADVFEPLHVVFPHAYWTPRWSDGSAPAPVDVPSARLQCLLSNAAIQLPADAPTTTRRE